MYEALDLAGLEVHGVQQDDSSMVARSEREPRDAAFALVSKMFLHSSTYMVYSCRAFRETFNEDLAALFMKGTDDMIVQAYEDEFDIILWMLIVIVSCCSKHWRDRFIQHIARLLHFLNADLDYLQNLRQDFPWTDGFGLGACQDIWREAMSAENAGFLSGQV